MQCGSRLHINYSKLTNTNKKLANVFYIRLYTANVFRADVECESFHAILSQTTFQH